MAASPSGGLRDPSGVIGSLSGRTGRRNGERSERTPSDRHCHDPHEPGEDLPLGYRDDAMANQIPSSWIGNHIRSQNLHVQSGTALFQK